MNIQDVISKLQVIQSEHGNIPVVIEDSLGYFETCSVDVVDIDRYSFVDAPRGVVIY